MFSRLSLEQLEELAAQSQALVDKAMAMANGSDVETHAPVAVPDACHPPARDAVQPAAKPDARNGS